MTRRYKAIALAFVGALAVGPAVWAQTSEDPVPVTTTTSSRPAEKLEAQYAVLAGSERNAESLIAGLRDGKPVLLLATPDSTNPDAASLTFTPLTPKLGYGNVNIALSLAQADLAKVGITAPTPEQLAAALNGGEVTTEDGQTITFAGVLAQRQSGMGWGAITNAMGVKLGAVVSASKTNKPLSEFKASSSQKSKTATASTTSTERGKSSQANGNSSTRSGGNSDSRGNSGNGGGGNSGKGGGGGNGGGGGGGSGGGGGGGGGRGK